MVIVSELRNPHFMNASAGPPMWALSARKVSVSVKQITFKVFLSAVKKFLNEFTWFL